MPDDFDPAAIEPDPAYAGMVEFNTEIGRLAALPPHEYDRVRRSEAQRLGVGVGTLDKAVQATRPREEAGEGQGEPITFEDPDPFLVRPSAAGGAQGARPG